MTTAVSVESLGKRYRLGGSASGYQTIREAVTDAAAAAFRRTRADAENDFWALRDLNFKISAGETVGIIGRNGAGKSTFLKILSRITMPTTGRVEIRGRVSSLLEVGTGFHPELTGRENIFLNGTILGMRRREIQANLDAIVDFAEIERFLDTPVKRYSSGMYVRLAFAVAAHLQTDIMIVDEVLAVGDVRFQQKCIGRMQNASTQGRTVLFVSHNMSALAQLCARGIVLDGGKVALDAPVQDAISHYLGSARSGAGAPEFAADPTKPLQIRRITTRGADGAESPEMDRKKPFEVVVEVEARENLRGAIILTINTAQGVRVLRTVSADHLQAFTEFKAGSRATLAAQIPAGFLNEGLYSASAWVVPGATGVYDNVESGLFSLRDPDGVVSFIGERKPDTAVLRLPIPWRNS